MFKNSKIKLWRFPLQNNRSRFEDGGFKYFEIRSTEKASELGCRVEAIKRVRLQRLRNNAWILNGIVVLDDHKANSNPSAVERYASVGDLL